MKTWIIDSHCDTITKIMNTQESLYLNKGHLDIQRMQKINLKVQFFAAWIAPVYCPSEAIKQTLRIIDKFYDELEKNEQYIALAKSYDDIVENISNNKISAILTIEGGEALEGDLSVLRVYHRLGVRGITLTWNYRNQIADGVKDGSSNGGLTPFGKEVIKEMNRLRMMIDVSHISEAGFWDVVSESETPVFASHSNTKMWCNHPRNLSDEQIKAIANKDGIIGMNFYPSFVKSLDDVYARDIIAHINHIKKLVGIQCIGLGGDYDGIEKTPEDMSDILGYRVLAEELLREQYSLQEIDQIFHENFMQFIKKMLK